MEDLQIFLLLFLRARNAITLLALFRLQFIFVNELPFEYQSMLLKTPQLIVVLYFIILIIDLLQSLLDTWANK